MTPFQIYKPGQGRTARLSSGVLLGLLTAYGCSSLKVTLIDAGTLPAFMLKLFFGHPVTYGEVIPVIVFIFVMAAVVWMLNYPKFADFLIETEIEMSRVAWPTRSTVVGSSVVVIVTVIVMSVLLYLVDWGFLLILTKAGLY